MDVTFVSVMCLFINEDGVPYGAVLNGLYAVHPFADASNRNPYCSDQQPVLWRSAPRCWE